MLFQIFHLSLFFYISSRRITFCQLFVLVQRGISQVQACLTNVQTTKKFFYIFVPRLPGYPLLPAVYFSLADTVATRILASCGLQNTKCPYEFSIIHIGPTYRVDHSPLSLQIVFPGTYKFDRRMLHLGSYYLPTTVLFSPSFLLISFPFFCLNLSFRCNERKVRRWSNVMSLVQNRALSSSR